MRAFYLSWVSFFACFVSTFAAPPLLPIIRDNLNLQPLILKMQGLHPSPGQSLLELPWGLLAIYLDPVLPLTHSPHSVGSLLHFNCLIPYLFPPHTVFFTGFPLATFVSTQLWMSSMFFAPVVGSVNGVSGGWGNLGGGATQLIMLLVCLAHLLPWCTPMGTIRQLIAILIFGQDMPNGNYKNLQKSGEKPKDKFSRVFFYHGVTNYRGWILALTYGYFFGVELAVDNIVAKYFYDRFNLKLHTARIIAVSFGLANLVSRPAGGMLSNAMAKRYGMRGMLWSLWVVQTLGGVLCVVLGWVGSLASSVVVMIVLSLFVQAACGLTFVVVPLVSRR